MIQPYICLECGELFDEPQTVVERHGFKSPPYETTTCCPHCGGAYTRTIVCDGCGEAVTGDYVLIESEKKCYCDACFVLRSLDD
jgi:formylmethanofuran dehydrogenase subunit E